MIELFYWTTPNGHKITMFLEEAGLPYRITPVNISNGEQFEPEFLALSPNNRIPAIVDHAPSDGGEPLSVFESGAILVYLAEKSGTLLSRDLRTRTTTLSWLMWQMGGLGPMLGQNHHFRTYAPESIDYAIERYTNEASRLYAVLDRRLAGHTYLAGEYSIADIATYPWARLHARQGIDIAKFPEVKRWLDAVAARPATGRAYAKASEVNPDDAATVSEDSRAILFGQTAQTIKQSR